MMSAAVFLMCSCLGADHPVLWGVTGHPGAQEGYREVPVAEQLNLLAELGATWYRCDWSEGSLESGRAEFEQLLNEAARHGMHLLPILFPTVGATSDAAPQAIREAAFRFGRTIAERYRGRITHYELANERDNFAMIHKGEVDRAGKVWEWGDPNGDQPEHFEEGRYQKVKAEIIGLQEGIKAGDPAARTIVNSGGWLHYGFFERLVREDHVAFDILGWHWYSDMGELGRAHVGVEVNEILRGFGKPIWVTELNRRGGNLGGTDKEQCDYLAQSAHRAMTLPGIEAFFVYELLDEPYFGPDNPESYYGLVRLDRKDPPRWHIGDKKPAFDTLRRIFTGTR